MIDIVKDKNWQEWKSFPDPRKGQYLFAPFGYGVYQVFNKKQMNIYCLEEEKMLRTELQRFFLNHLVKAQEIIIKREIMY